MKWTYDWLKDYLETDANPCEIANTLTKTGLEVEDLIESPLPIVAKIIECSDISDTHLHVLMVDDGSGALRQVVCGAPNARAGLISALAVPGCKIGDMEIKSGKIRGFLSDGMMCSEKELGIGDNHDGIIELASDSKLGSPATNEKPITIFDAGITPNRPDYLSVRGIARDLAASGTGTFKNKNCDFIGETKGERRVKIENYASCPTYYLCEIKNIKMSPSNSLIASRLSAIGINPKNAPIDATNYVCYDLGQPMHCFDADEVAGDIIVRNAKDGEEFTDLFGNKHTLIETDLVIADGKGILALAGVVGGSRGMTTDKTKNVILESAYFEPVGIRKTSKRLGVQSDASYRYERGIDPKISFTAIASAAKLIHDECGGDVCIPLRDWDQKNPILGDLDPRRISYSPTLFAKKTGFDMPENQQKEILGKLGFVIEENKDTWVIIPPSARVDVLIPENIISELVRIGGYDKIKTKKNEPKHQPIYNPVKVNLNRFGYTENISFSFTDSKIEEIIGITDHVKVKNPITNELNVMRKSLISNLLLAVKENERRGRTNLRMFEQGTVFDGYKPGQQHQQLAIVRTGLATDKAWAKHGRECDIYDIRDAFLQAFPDKKVSASESVPAWAHPYRYGRLSEYIEFGELHPSIAKKLKIKTKVIIGIINIPTGRSFSEEKSEKIVSDKSGRKPSMSDLLPITRDFAFITDVKTEPKDLLDVAIAADEQITDANIFDVFEMGDGNKSVAFEILIEPNKNLNSEELLEIQNAVIESVEKKCNAKIRDK